MLNFKKWLAEQSEITDFPKSRFNLTPLQVAAIKRYRGDGHKYEIKRSRKTLDDIINKAPLTKRETIVYRGLLFKPWMLKDGSHINDKLVSTSLNLSVAKAFAWKTGHVVIIKIPAGSRVLNLADFGEKEILIKSQSRFKYDLNPKVDDGITYWHATLVADGSKK